MILRTAAASVALLMLAACPKHNEGATDGGAPMDASVQAPAATIYPLDAGPPDPLATKLCHALQDVPASRHAECCGDAKSFVFVTQCEVLLSAALHAKAVMLAPADVDTCATAIDQQTVGCDWVSRNAPSPPKECLGIVHGTSTAGARCRSTLECADGGRCVGVGPNRVGTCGATPKDDDKCGGTVDSLATYVRDITVDTAHPECTGYCKRSKCAPATALGEACTFNEQCGAHKFCAAGKCRTDPSKIGEACVGAVCEPGAACIDMKCSPLRTAGATCTKDEECVGGCIAPNAGSKGTCGKKCN
jgi:hypothetical protein